MQEQRNRDTSAYVVHPVHRPRRDKRRVASPDHNGLAGQFQTLRTLQHMTKFLSHMVPLSVG